MVSVLQIRYMLLRLSRASRQSIPTASPQLWAVASRDDPRQEMDWLGVKMLSGLFRPVPAFRHSAVVSSDNSHRYL